MARMKPLMPSLREKKRYIVFAITSIDDINSISNDVILKALNKHCLAYFGILYSAKAGINIFPNLYKNGYGIIRVSRKYALELKLILPLMRKIELKNNSSEIEVNIKVVGVSGILAKARDNFLPKEIALELKKQNTAYRKQKKLDKKTETNKKK
jgi:RNase P/RNase MRP subunit POP5